MAFYSQTQEEFDRLVEGRFRHKYLPSFLSKETSKLKEVMTIAGEREGSPATTISRQTDLVDNPSRAIESIPVGKFIGLNREDCIKYFLKKSPSNSEASSDRAGIQQRGGFSLLGDNLLLFINLLGPGDALAKKNCGNCTKVFRYLNEFFDAGRYFTWFIESRRLKQLFETPEKDYEVRNVPSVPGTSAGRNIYLFVRQRKGSYVHCGQCQVIQIEPLAGNKNNMTKVTFELVQEYDLKNSKIYSEIIKSHVEELNLLYSVK